MGFVEKDGHYYPRCGDCGGAIEERKVSKRESICDDCWERRGWLLENREIIGMAEFKKIQSVMAHHTGTAKRRILKLQKEII